MRTTPFTLAVVMALAWGSRATRAEPIYESADLGWTGGGSGPGVSTTQFIGSRFHVDQAVEVTGIGGHLGSDGTIFGALVSLDSPTALPSGSPIVSDPLAVTTFDAGLRSRDLVVPLSATLEPGDYALIFGSGWFGATGTGFLPANNVVIPGRSANFWWRRGAWDSVGLTETRVVVDGIFLDVAAGCRRWRGKKARREPQRPTR